MGARPGANRVTAAADSRGEGAGGRSGYLKIQKHAARYVLASTRLREERVERIVSATDGLVGGHLSIRLDAVLQAIQLPASVADLRNSWSLNFGTQQSVNRQSVGRSRPATQATGTARMMGSLRAGLADGSRPGLGGGDRAKARTRTFATAAAPRTESAGRGGPGQTAKFKTCRRRKGWGREAYTYLDAGLADVDGDHFAHGG